MKSMLNIILALTLLPCFASAQYLGAASGDTSLIGQVRERGGFVPGVARTREAGIVPASYRTVQNPDYPDPANSALPNLTEKQVNGLIGALIELEVKKRGLDPAAVKPADLQLSRDTIMRVASRMVQIDKLFVDPVPPKVWDAAIADMLKTAEGSYDPAKKNWDAVADQMLKKGMKNLKDPFSVYWTKQEYKAFQDRMSNKFYGIGVSLKQDGKDAVVDFVFPDSPAAKAGLKPGDRLSSIDGKPVAGMPTDEIIKRIGGDNGTQVKVGVTRNGQPVPEMTATRGEIKTKNVFGEMAGDGIGYVRLEQFGDNSDKEVFAKIQELQLQGAKKLVFDIRGNPGGRTDIVASIASEFLKDGQTIVSYSRQGVEMHREVTDGDGRFAGMPLAVLTDGGSASASEIMSGAMQDNKRATLIGTGPTYGKGVGQAVMPDKTGAAMKLTTFKWNTPNGTNVDGQHDPGTGARVAGTGGVKPDVTVPATEEQEAAILKQIYRKMHGAPPPDKPVEDPALKKAIEVLSKPAA